MLASAGLGALAVQGLHAQAKPLGYIITEVEIIDQAAFNEFGPKAAAALQKSGGKYLKAAAAFGPNSLNAAWSMISDRKSTRLNSSHVAISYAVFCLKKK